MAESDYDLFGGSQEWKATDWTSSDDRVRGGKSQSYLDFVSDSQGKSAVFHGDLDIKTLGGAGFASQRTKDSLTWDLSKYDGIRLALGKSDGKKYTFNLKDESLPQRPDGREQSTISWEYDFDGKDKNIFIPWSELKPTYRGRPKTDAEPLNLKSVQRISLMMRSFFGTQEGPFRLEVHNIKASKKHVERPVSVLSAESLDKGGVKVTQGSWKDWLCGVLKL